MSTRITTQLVCDVDEQDAERTVRFSLDGTAYEIDACAAHAAGLAEAFAPYAERARRIRNGRPSNGRPRNVRAGRAAAAAAAPPARPDPAAVREWAAAVGIHVAARGRISPDVVRQYQDAQQAMFKLGEQG